MSGERQAALLLHGLDRADQRWLLARLDAGAARVLRGHLRELADLGIPADPALAPGAAPAGMEAAAAAVHAASAAQIQLLLADEPAWLAAQLLALRAWPWRAAYLDSLPAPQRAQAAAAPAEPLRPAAARALLAALAGRLPAPAAPAGALVRLQSTLRSWF
ncbi:MAG: hypothetical protein ACXU8N_08680 [Telluria sp.]